VQVFFLCVVDVIMIVSGFVSFSGESNVGIWPFYVFSCIMQIIIVGTLVSHLDSSRRSPDVHPVEVKVYQFLAIWTIVTWTVFPIKFAILEAGAMLLETDVIIGCICDIGSKVRCGAQRSTRHRPTCTFPFTPHPPCVRSSSAYSLSGLVGPWRGSRLASPSSRWPSSG